MNLHIFKEYQRLQKEGCRTCVATFNRHTQNNKINALRICHEHFTTGISTELRFPSGTYLQLVNIRKCKQGDSFHLPFPEITGRCKQIELMSFRNTLYVKF